MVNIDTRKIGSQGLEAAPLGLGCMGMSEFYGTADEGEAVRTIHRALELGVTLLDTADMYGPFTNEKLVGRAVREWSGERPLIATKFGNVRGENGEFLGIRGDAEYVRSACEASLERLGVETIDLYYQHRVDPETPIEETVGAMAELVQEGKVRYLGLSEAGAQTIRKAVEVHPISALQSEYSLWERSVEQEILPAVRELGIGFVAYSPLGRGFLTGKIRSVEDLQEGDARRAGRFPRFERENLEANLAVVEQVEAVAARHGAAPGQVALAWVLSRGEDVIAIPGTKRVERVEENVGALDVELTGEDLAELDDLADAVAGGRYTPDGMQTVGR
jgi:aryl-alcohol dehydrogenase-like predicted oxidoreductase